VNDKLREQEKSEEMLEGERIRKDAEQYLAEERCKAEERTRENMLHRLELARHDENTKHMKNVYQMQIEVIGSYCI